MLTLDQAIELAQKAHEGQWRRAIAIYPQEELADYFESKGDSIIYDSYLITRDQTGWKKQQPYITHPLQVMEMMTTEKEKIVAVLHDVVEDTETELFTEYGKCYILFNGVQYRISIFEHKALQTLTKIKDEAYTNYIERVSKNALATKVKIADIVCNLADNPSEHAKQKYLKALPILLKG